MTLFEENLLHFPFSLSSIEFIPWYIRCLKIVATKGKFYVENSADEMIFMDMLLYRSNEYFMQSYTFFLKYHTIAMDTLSMWIIQRTRYIHVSFLFEKFYSI